MTKKEIYWSVQNCLKYEKKKKLFYQKQQICWSIENSLDYDKKPTFLVKTINLLVSCELLLL